MKRLFFLFLTFFTLVGCKNIQPKLNSPEKHFVFVLKNVEASVCHTKKNECLPLGEGGSSSSGFLIAHNSKLNKSYYLTAGHSCLDELKSNNKTYEARFNQEIILLDYDEEKIFAKIIAIDKKHDICLLETERVKHMPAIMAKNPPKNHTKVFNIAAPAAIWKNDMMIHFFGEYQGIYEDQALYTLVAQPGSSGSPIYDASTGRVIGMVTEVILPSFSISVGPTTKQINKFLKKHLPK